MRRVSVKSRKLTVSFAFPLLLCLAWQLCTGTGGAQDYPRLIAFRVSEGLQTEDDYAPYALYDLVHSIDNLNFEYLRKCNPTAPVVPHWRLGIAQKPGTPPIEPVEEKYYLKKLGDQVWPGHWLLYNGTKLTRSLPADRGRVIVHVEDTGVFQDPSEAPPEFGPDDIQIYAINENGVPLWDRTEQMILESIDHSKKTITVRRGQYSSGIKRFKAGLAVAAVHARTHLVSGPDPYVWRLNFTRHCPINPQDGLTAAQFEGRFIAHELNDNPSFAGAEFDVAEWEVRSRTLTEHRNYDADNDLIPDGCYFEHPGVGVVNEHGLGQITCMKTIREGVGGKKILQTDNEMRAYAYLNGCEWEKYPIDKWLSSSQMDHARYVSARLRYLPKISYFLGKQFTDEYNSNPSKKWGDNWFRVGLASALIENLYYGYNAVNPNGDKEYGLGLGRFYAWDEYNGGNLNQKHYLGSPLGSSNHLPGRLAVQTVLSSLRKRSSVQITTEEGYSASSRYNVADDVLTIEIFKQPSIPSKKGITVFIPKKDLSFPDKSPFTFTGAVRAITSYGKIDPDYAEVSAVIECTVNPLMTTMPYLHADAQWRSFNVSLYSDSDFKGLTLYLGEDPGIFEFRNSKLRHGDAFVMYRLFENGIVLLNGTNSNVSFDLNKIDPERQYKAIDGIVTPEVNDGRPIETPVIVPPIDARILVLSN
jgi:hypothetical protein